MRNLIADNCTAYMKIHKHIYTNTIYIMIACTYIWCRRKRKGLQF